MSTKIEGLQIMDLILYNQRYYTGGEKFEESIASKALFEKAGPFIGGHAVVETLDGKRVIIDETGVIIYTLNSNQKPCGFNERHAVIINRYSPKGEAKGFEIIDEKGQLKLAAPTSKYFPFNTKFTNGLMILNQVVEYDNPFGPKFIMGEDLKDYIFINYNGEVVFRLNSNKYYIDKKHAYFSYGLMPVKNGKHFVYIDNTGMEQIILHHTAISCTPFVYGIAEVKTKSNKTYYINTLGERLVEKPDQKIINAINHTKLITQIKDDPIAKLNSNGINVANQVGSFTTGFGAKHYPRKNPIIIRNKNQVDDLLFDLAFEEIVDYNENWLVMRIKHGLYCYVNLDGHILGAENTDYTIQEIGIKTVYGLNYGDNHLIWFQDVESRNEVGHHVDEILEKANNVEQEDITSKGYQRKKRR